MSSRSEAKHRSRRKKAGRMQPVETSRSYEVERRSYHAARPGFRIAEMQISQTQTIPWHYHTQAHDTFYVISGSIRIFARDPEEDVCLTIGQTYYVRPKRPHLVTNAGQASAIFLVLQGMGEHDFIALT